MAEFRPNSSPPGLFATKSYEAGEIILDEAPLFVFRPVSDEQDAAVTSQFRNISSNPSAVAAAASSGSVGKKRSNRKKKAMKSDGVKFAPSLNEIQPPPSVDKAYAGKFRSMITAAGMYAVALANNDINDKSRNHILALYAPNIESPSDNERQIVSTACAALKYCRDNAVDGSSLAALVKGDNETQKECLQVMLIWSCNAFEGGMLYHQTSRANHSCDANAIVRESLVVSTPAAASASSETSISNSDEDRAFEQPRNQQLIATTAIEAGDEITISYLGIFLYAGGSVRQDQLRKTKHFTCRCSRCTAVDRASAIPCLSCHPRVNGRYLDEEIQYDDDKTVKYSYPKNAATATLGVRCEHCNETTNASSLMAMVNKVSDKVTDRLEQSFLTKRMEEDANDAEQEMDEQLHHLASSVLGARHWTTNLMALSILERQLSAIHSATLMGGSAPDLTELAECIDTLQRLWDFVGGLDLRADAGHLLSGPTIGVARALVSLGDVKSRRYAAEWVARVEDYVLKFEGDDMVKVVDALKEAWKRNDLEAVINEDMEEVEEVEDIGSNKRARVS